MSGHELYLVRLNIILEQWPLKILLSNIFSRKYSFFTLECNCIAEYQINNVTILNIQQNLEMQKSTSGFVFICFLRVTCYVSGSGAIAKKEKHVFSIRSLVYFSILSGAPAFFFFLMLILTSFNISPFRHFQ